MAGNWKMHGNLQQNAALLSALTTAVAPSCEVGVCVPYPYLSQAGQLLAGSGLALGAQNVSEHAVGAYTGEVSATMLADFGCRYVLVGHSERRTLFGETDAQVAAKCLAAQDAGLVPVLCVGETLAERQAGVTETVVGRQLAAVLDGLVPERLERLMVAYEPVWAIGTGLTASPEEAQAVHAFIRHRLATVDMQAADGVRILYGGSVKPQNAATLFAQPDIDGGLIGGASLVAEDFLAICQAAK